MPIINTFQFADKVDAPGPQELGFVPVVGNTLVLAYATRADAGVLSGISQTGATWTLAAANQSGIKRVEIWYAPVTGVVDEEFTLNFSASAISHKGFAIFEVDNILSVGDPVDVTADDETLETHEPTTGMVGTDSLGCFLVGIISATAPAGEAVTWLPPATNDFVLNVGTLTVAEGGDFSVDHYFNVVSKQAQDAGLESAEIPIYEASPAVSNMGLLVAFKTAVPNKVTLPLPANGSVEFDPQGTFGWASDNDAVTFNVYVGDTFVALGLVGASATTSFTPPTNTLAYDTTYYWRVDAVAASGVVVQGDIWSFQTIGNTWQLDPRHDHVEAGQGNFLYQFRRNAIILLAYAASLLQQVQDLEDALWDIFELLNPAVASGVHLDRLGKLVGQPREGRDDQTYRLWIMARILINRSSGTPDNILNIAQIVTNSTAELVELYPGSYEIGIFGVSVTQAVASILAEADPIGVNGALITSESFEPYLMTLSAEDGTSHLGLADENETTGGELANLFVI